MSIWSWSLLQFCIVPTTFKELPEVAAAINPDDFDSIEQSGASKPQKTLEQGNPYETNPTGTAVKATEDSKKKNGKKEPNGAKSTEHSNPVTSTAKDKPSKGNKEKITSVSAPRSRNKVGVVDDGKASEAPQINSAPKSKGNTFATGTPYPISNDETKKQISTPNGKTTKNPLADTKKQNGNTNKTQPSKMNNAVATNETVNNELSQWDHAVIVIHDTEDDLKIQDTADEWIAGKRCCTSFCYYNEIWGMVLSLAFQDGPFLITRLVIMFHYKVVSHMTVFFTFKNIVTIVLVLNRIRVVVLEERKPWKEHMAEVMRVRKRNNELLREQRRRQQRSDAPRAAKYEKPAARDPSSKTEQTQSGNQPADGEEPKRTTSWFKKPKWLFWRI